MDREGTLTTRFDFDLSRLNAQKKNNDNNKGKIAEQEKLRSREGTFMRVKSDQSNG